MNIRSFRASDLPNLIDLTIEVFGPFYERSFRSMVPADVYMHHHGSWADDYRTSVPQLHDPSAGKVVAIAPSDGDEDEILGFVAWEIEAEIRHGTIAMVAVRESARGAGLGRALCGHAVPQGLAPEAAPNAGASPECRARTALLTRRFRCSRATP